MKKRIIIAVICVCLLFGRHRRKGTVQLRPDCLRSVGLHRSNYRSFSAGPYNQLVQAYQIITNQYNQMPWMPKMLPENLANFRATQTPWFLSSAKNTYGTTAGWITSINTGANVPAGYSRATDQLLPYGAALSNVPADQLTALEKHYATIELADGANQDGIETIGTLRNNAPQVEEAMQSLEDASLDSDPDSNTEIAVLNKINAASVIALRNGQDTNKLLTAVSQAAIHRLETTAGFRGTGSEQPRRIPGR